MAHMLQALVAIAGLLALADALHPFAARRAALSKDAPAAEDDGDEVSLMQLQSNAHLNAPAVEDDSGIGDEVSFLQLQSAPHLNDPAVEDDSIISDEVSLLQVQSGLDAHLHVVEDSHGDAFVGIAAPSPSWNAFWHCPLKTLLGRGRCSEDL